MIGTMSKLSVKTVSGTARPTIDELGDALLQALGPWRPLAFSLHDSAGEALWLSAGSIGPDEYSLVYAALDLFALEMRRNCIHRKLEDGRRALFLAARDPLGGCSGLGFALIEGGPVDESRVISAPLRALLQRFSMLMAPKVEKRGIPAPATPETASTAKLPDGSPIRARAYTRLHAGSVTRRYEVSLAGVDAQHDAAVFERVIEWLIQHRQRHVSKPSSFTVAISAAAAHDPRFVRRVESCLSRNELGEGVVMLLLPADAWAAEPDRLLPLLETCERLHCHVILDDFTINEAALQLLRHKSIRMLKLRAELTTAAMLDRYPRALLSACTQIARVLGIHCIAKQVESTAASRWLASAGIDYIDPFNPAETAAAAETEQASALSQAS
jgi:EAL domain-containing protein (putative c-di-GMP-specific phosphodiesterase class I)